MDNSYGFFQRQDKEMSDEKLLFYTAFIGWDYRDTTDGSNIRWQNWGALL